MRKLLPVLLIAALSCQTGTTTSPAPSTAPSTAPSLPATTAPASGPWAITAEEEAQILALEDRREYNAAVVTAWVHHPNALHRQRIALALGRIAPATFIDANGNGMFEEGQEPRAGTTELISMSHDPERNVRETVAFALGETTDPTAVGTLLSMMADPDAGVAAEAVEGVSKFGGSRSFALQNLERYLWMTAPSVPEGIRARAYRFLFRFDFDKASAAAVPGLEDPSSAIRQEAAYSLARRAYAPARLQLELVMTDANVLTRSYAAAALGRIADAASLPALIKALGDAHPWVRTNAATALSKILDKNPQAVREDDLPRLFAAVEDIDPGVRVSAIDVLGAYAVKNETARARLQQVLSNGTMWDREAAAGTIAKHFRMKNKMFAQLLDSQLTPWQIVRILEATGSAKRAPELWKRFVTSDVPMVRVAVYSAISDENADAQAELIKQGLKDPDVVVRAAAIDRYAALTKEPADAWVATLEAAEKRERKSPENDARLAAINGLASFDYPGRHAFIQSLLKDDDPVVRRVAAELFPKKLNAGIPQYTPLPIRRSRNEYIDIARWAQQPHTATIHMTRGLIQLALLTQDAPMTAWNFAQLAGKKYFDNSTFMRVVPNFVVQGGDPRNDMSGGPGYAIRDEMNLQKYTRGAVGMALSGADTGGSQFFIVHSPQPHLDGGYTVFARVYEGMSGVVDQIERGDKVETVTIDEHAPVSADELQKAAAASLLR